MKYIGIDYGAKRIGIAVADGASRIAFPRETLSGEDAAIEAVRKLAGEGAVIVLGDTRSHGGFDNPVTAAADVFAARLGSEGFRIERVFEGWSSIEASRYAPEGKTHDDAAAAAIILQRFLDMKESDIQ